MVPSRASFLHPVVKLGKSARFSEEKNVEIHLTEAFEAQSGFVHVNLNGEADLVSKLSFEYFCGESTADTGETADGLSVSFGSLGQLDDKSEYGTKDGLVLSFIDFKNNADELYGISAFYDKGSELLTKKIAGPAHASDFCDSKWHAIDISVCPEQKDAHITVSIDKMAVLQFLVPNYDVSGRDLVFAARTGQSNAKHALKSLSYSADICQTTMPITSMTTFANVFQTFAFTNLAQA